MSFVNESKICPCCGKSFSKKEVTKNIKKHLIERTWNNRRFCSQKCTDRYHSGNYISFNKKLNIEKCQICGYDEYPILEVHHIKERRNGGTNDLNNLIVVCPNCHRKIHKKIITFAQGRIDEYISL